jgi:hypothetical protein
VSTLNSFYVQKKKLATEKIWDIDLNIHSTRNWVKVEIGELERNEVSCLSFSCFSFVEFKINYEKLLTCYIASRIEKERIEHAKRKREQRKKLLDKLFNREVGNYSLDDMDHNQSNHEDDFNMEETNEQATRQIKNQSFLMNERDPSKNFISKPKNNSIYKSKNNNTRMKEFNFRKAKMKSEIEELFEQEGKTIWNFSFSDKLKEGLLQDLEQFMYLSKNEMFEERHSDENFNQEVLNLKQSVDVRYLIVFFLILFR